MLRLPSSQSFFSLVYTLSFSNSNSKMQSHDRCPTGNCISWRYRKSSQADKNGRPSVLVLSLFRERPDDVKLVSIFSFSWNAISVSDSSPATFDDSDTVNKQVLLSMGVSSHNELEQVEALNYMRKWITLHPNYTSIAKEHFGSVPDDEFLTVSSVAGVFEMAAKSNPLDGNVHAALGVLYNIASMQEQAEQAFHAAVQLSPKVIKGAPLIFFIENGYIYICV